MYKVGKLGLEHAKCSGLYRYKPLSFHAFEYQLRLIYTLAFDINVYIRQPAASLATEISSFTDLADNDSYVQCNHCDTVNVKQKFSRSLIPLTRYYTVRNLLTP